MLSDTAKKFIFQASREFVQACTDYSFMPTMPNYARVKSRLLQLSLANIPPDQIKFAEKLVKTFYESFLYKERIDQPLVESQLGLFVESVNYLLEDRV
jgi:hypothetical protein